jgi:hypothetical protein
MSCLTVAKIHLEAYKTVIAELGAIATVAVLIFVCNFLIWVGKNMGRFSTAPCTIGRSGLQCLL